MTKLIYLTTNKGKVEEANRIFKNKYGFDVEIVEPNFKIPEIQANSCKEVVEFSVKYAANKLGYPCVKSDSGLYLDCLGGLPGPYNAYFDKQIGVEKFLNMIKEESNRKARLEDCFAYCAPGEDPIVFFGGGNGVISYSPIGTMGRWHDFFYIPNGETKTLSQLREENPEYEAQFWGTAIEDFAKWYNNEVLGKSFVKNK